MSESVLLRQKRPEAVSSQGPQPPPPQLLIRKTPPHPDPQTCSSALTLPPQGGLLDLFQGQVSEGGTARAPLVTGWLFHLRKFPGADQQALVNWNKNSSSKIPRPCAQTGDIQAPLSALRRPTSFPNSLDLSPGLGRIHHPLEGLKAVDKPDWLCANFQPRARALLSTALDNPRLCGTFIVNSHCLLGGVSFQDTDCGFTSWRSPLGRV
jgi:hypothetical protein